MRYAYVTFLGDSPIENLSGKPWGERHVPTVQRIRNVSLCGPVLGSFQLIPDSMFTYVGKSHGAAHMLAAVRSNGRRLTTSKSVLFRFIAVSN